MQDSARCQKKEMLTDAEIEEIEKKTIDDIRDKLAIAKHQKGFDQANQNGYFPDSSDNLTAALEKSYRALENAPLDKIIILRKKISTMMIELKAVDIICEIYKYYTNHGWTYKVNGVEKVNLKKTGLFINSILVLYTYTDPSDELAVYIADYPDMLESIRHVLVESKEEHFSNKQETNGAKITSLSQELAYNISMRDVNGTRLRDLDFTSAVQPFLHSPNELIQLIAFATLACIVNEKESEVINANQGKVKIVLQCLEKGLESKMRRDDGWSCKECALIVRMLARNDANKKMLAELGAVELLVKVGQTGHEEEKYGHFIEGDESDENKKGAFKKKKTANSSKGDEHGHIMISYQWANQKTLIKVRDELRANGFKVWMDIDQMAGSTLQSMADAVENSTIFLMSMSDKYKDSQNCRAEAEYAFTRKVNIIPLLMDQEYRADGWLGFLLGAKLFFDFSGKYPFMDKMGDLIKEINIFKQQHDGTLMQATITPKSVTHVTGTPIDTVDSPQVHHPVSRPNLVSKTMLSKVRQWKRSDVEIWIDNNDLKSCGVSELTGGELALLLKMQQDAPEYFYKRLETMLNDNNLLSMSKIVWALTDLAEQQ